MLLYDIDGKPATVEQIRLRYKQRLEGRQIFSAQSSLLQRRNRPCTACNSSSVSTTAVMGKFRENLPSRRCFSAQENCNLLEDQQSLRSHSGSSQVNMRIKVEQQISMLATHQVVALRQQKELKKKRQMHSSRSVRSVSMSTNRDRTDLVEEEDPPGKTLPAIVVNTTSNNDNDNSLTTKESDTIMDQGAPKIGSWLPPKKTKGKRDSMSKQSFGLRLAVADFSKKIKDNEGMGISTYSYLEEEEEDTGSVNAQQNPDSATSKSPDPDDDAKAEERRLLRKHLASLSISMDDTQRQLTAIEKMKRGIKTADLMIKACTSKVEQTKKTNRKYLTFADLEDEAKAAVAEATSSLAFDLSFYRARTERCLPNDAVKVLRIHPHLRSDEMIRAALAGMTNTVEAFGEFPKAMQRSLMQRGYYESFGPKRVIIRQGHAALNFYFIISGVTMVTVARQNKITGDTYGETVAFLKKGNSFGELALMYGGKRSATVSCKTDVELLAVSRDDFIDIFMNLSAETEPDHIAFLRQIPLLDDWPIHKLPYDDPSVCLFTYFRRGTVLSRDSNNNDWIYFIKTGNCRIIKDVPLNANSKETFFQKTLPLESQYHKFLHNQSLFGSSRDEEAVRRARSAYSRSSEGVPSRVKGKLYIQLRILGPRDTFGLEPIAFEIIGGTSSVTLVSDGAECVAIHKNFFKQFVTPVYLRRLRLQLQKFPPPEDLEAKLKDYYDWDAYRSLVMDGISRYKDGLVDTIHI